MGTDDARQVPPPNGGASVSATSSRVHAVILLVFLAGCAAAALGIGRCAESRVRDAFPRLFVKPHAAPFRVDLEWVIDAGILDRKDTGARKAVTAVDAGLHGDKLVVTVRLSESGFDEIREKLQGPCDPGLSFTGAQLESWSATIVVGDQRITSEHFHVEAEVLYLLGPRPEASSVDSDLDPPGSTRFVADNDGACEFINASGR